LGDPFHDKESEQFVARYIERAPVSLEKLSIQDDIVTYTPKDGAAHEFDALEFLAQLSSHILVPRLKQALGRDYPVEYSRADYHKRRIMKHLDIPIITKTYELYRALHDLQKGIPKMEGTASGAVLRRPPFRC
jgi:hypothetical protein